MVEYLLFWISLLLLFHSYVLFPLIIHFLSIGRQNNQLTYSINDDLPSVSFILSVFNEESILQQRIRNIFCSRYPFHLMEVLVGSDGSNDGTNEILKQLQEEFPGLKIFVYKDRRGKGNVLNDLVAQATNEILVFTDAKVLFSSEVVFELVKHFKNPNLGITGGNLVNPLNRKDGISFQESRFMAREISIKYAEGVVWGSAIGVYGACFAMRRVLFERIPEGFAVEDFYITLKTLEKGYTAIMEPDAVCYEEVPNRMDEEFRRKIRISSGNFQNLRSFLPFLFKLNTKSFCFFSHKVIRWIGPLLLLSALIFNLLIRNHSPFYYYLFLIQIFCLLIPILDFFLKKIHIHIIPLRFVTHFYSMNLALLLGLIKYLKGAKTNVWEPTKRS